MANASTETEMKFKLDDYKLPEKMSYKNIHQIYISDEFIPDTLKTIKNIAEVRIRCITENNKNIFFLTLKTDGDLSRREYEMEIDETEFNILKNKSKNFGSISKKRYEIPFSRLIFEVDVYNTGLMIAEVEFDKDTYTEKEIEACAKQVFGKNIINVTYDKKYKNKNLATALL